MEFKQILNYASPLDFVLSFHQYFMWSDHFTLNDNEITLDVYNNEKIILQEEYQLNLVDSQYRTPLIVSIQAVHFHMSFCVDLYARIM